ncbi:MAG TPA: ABC transporter permease [Candidatus Eisenbacteria bacterium]|nr:ABC transporter permease [Candidatus Eisenbacteria bacterium]
MTADLLVERGWRQRTSAGAAQQARDIVPPVVAFVALIVLWEVLVRALNLKQFILPGPLAIAAAWQENLPVLVSAATYTLGEILAGLAIGVTAGIVVGAAAARFGAIRGSLLPFAIVANSVPIIAFAPIFNNWFGSDNQFSKAMIAAVLVFFPVMINTLRGLLNVDPAALELLRSYAAPERTVFRSLRVPNSLPFIFTALRVATTLATIGAIVSEYFAAPRGSLGQYIATQSAFLAFERSWAAIVFAAAIGIGLYLFVVALERVVSPWARVQTAGDQ